MSNVVGVIRSFAKQNSSTILAVGAGGGVVATAYLSAKAGYRSAHKFEDQDPYMGFEERARMVWPLYIPAATCALITIGCVVSVKRIDTKKTLAAQTALVVGQRAYSQYRDQVIEELGEKKDQLFLSKVAEAKVREDPPPTTVIAGSGGILCFEGFTGRYFTSDMETLTAAVNEINAKMLKQDYATLDDLYYILGLQTTTVSGQTGWGSDRLLELEISTVLSPDKRPCLAFDYNYVKAL